MKFLSEKGIVKFLEFYPIIQNLSRFILDLKEEKRPALARELAENPKG